MTTAAFWVRLHASQEATRRTFCKIATSQPDLFSQRASLRPVAWISMLSVDLDAAHVRYHRRSRCAQYMRDTSMMLRQLGRQLDKDLRRCHQYVAEMRGGGSARGRVRNILEAWLLANEAEGEVFIGKGSTRSAHRLPSSSRKKQQRMPALTLSSRGICMTFSQRKILSFFRNGC